MLKIYTCTSIEKFPTTWYCCIGIIRHLFLDKLNIFISPRHSIKACIYSTSPKEAEELSEAVQNAITALDKFILKKGGNLTYSPLEKMTKLIVGIELLKYEKEHDPIG